MLELTLLPNDSTANEQLANVARQTMTELGGQIVPAMLELVDSPDEARKDNASWWLSNAADSHPEALNSDALAVATRILAAPPPADDSARKGPHVGLTMKILRHMGPAAKETVPLILSRVGVVDAEEVLIAIGVDVVPAVSAELGSAAPGHRLAAARVIAVLDPKAQPPIAALVGLLNADKIPRGPLRREAEDLLASIAKHNPQALAAAIGLLRSEHLWSIESASHVLKKLGPGAKSAVPDLLHVVAADDVHESQGPVKTLGAIGPDAKEAIPALIKLLEHRNEMLTDVVAEEMHHLGEDAIAPLTDVVQNGANAFTRARAAQAPGAVRPRRPAGPEGPARGAWLQRLAAARRGRHRVGPHRTGGEGGGTGPA